MILQGEIVLTNVNDGTNGTNGKDGVNPACYRLIQDGNGMCTAGLVLGTDASGKPKVSVDMAIDLSFSIYKFVGNSAERLGSSKDFAAESVFVPAWEATYGGITLETVNTGDGFDVGCDGIVSEKDIVNTLINMSCVKVTLKQGDKVWDTVTVPVVTDQGQAYSRTKAMLESIYTNTSGLSAITQRADRISAMVYSHGRNLLYDAGFTDTTPTLDGTMKMRRFQTSAGNTVTVNGDGTLTITAAGNTTAQYTGVYWYVPIQATGYYTASVEVLSGTTVTDGSFAIYTATLDRTQEQNMIGYIAIKTSDVGKRVTVTTNNELTEADFGKYLEVYVVVPTNGTIKIKCPQLERGKEATTWTLRGVEDGLMKAGVDIERGTVTQYGDRFKWLDATGKNMIAGMDADGNATFNGIVHAKGGEFTGKVTANSGKFTGEIEAQSGKITGDIDVEGTLNGGTIKGANIKSPILQWDDDSIQLNDGWLEFKGDLLSNYTFRLGDAYVRGWFGAYKRTTLVIKGKEATLYYGNRVSDATATFQLDSGYYNNTTYYVIPCYIASLYLSASENVAGVPIDTIMLQDTGSNYYYKLNMWSFQKVTVMSVNNQYKSNWIYKNGNLQRVEGGHYFNVHQVPVELMTPQPSASVPGAGQMWSAANDNDW